MKHQYFKYQYYINMCNVVGNFTWCTNQKNYGAFEIPWDNITMVTVRIVRDYAEYKVYHEGNLFIRAQDKSTFLNPGNIIFFDSHNHLIAKSKERTIFGIKIAPTKIYFTDGAVVILKERWSTDRFLFKDKQYCIKRNGSKTHELFKNNIFVGKLLKEKQGTSTYENTVTCNSVDECYIFSIISVLLYTFDVN